MITLNRMAVTMFSALAMLGAGIAGELLTNITGSPYLISLQFNRLPLCGGTIIRRNWIITSANCVTWADKSVVPAANLSVRAGSNFSTTGGVIDEVKRVFVHKKFNQNLGWMHNLALLELKVPLPLHHAIQTIKIRKEDVPDKVPVNVYSWANATGSVEKSTLNVMSQKDCNKRFGFDFDQIICFVHEIGQGVCTGDSGGPAIVNGKLVGVASFVKKGCDSKYPDIYVRLSEYVDWINKIIP